MQGRTVLVVLSLWVTNSFFVQAGDALAFAKEWGARYVEASAKTGDNVQAAFETLVALCVQKKDGSK
jgi:hypothetical protein